MFISEYFKSFILIIIFSSTGLSLATYSKDDSTAHSFIDHQTAHIAVASNFTKTIKTLVNDFDILNKEAPVRQHIKISIASSGKLYAQIKHGAPFDLFLSADQKLPKQLIEDNIAVPTSLITYAIGQLVLWSSDPYQLSNSLHSSNDILNNLSIHDKSDLAIRALNNPQLTKLALANARLAPYGKAAEEALESLQLKEFTRSKWVKGENISQAFQFVYTGNADLGFVALSQVLHNVNFLNQGSGWLVPTQLYTPIKQNAVILKHGQKNASALAFHDYLTSHRARQIIQKAGYLFQ